MPAAERRQETGQQDRPPPLPVPYIIYHRMFNQQDNTGKRMEKRNLVINNFSCLYNAVMNRNDAAAPTPC
jgi:hypothetical protein